MPVHPLKIRNLQFQDNLSFSVKGTLRGLHYQHPRPQAKIIQVLKGEVFDVALYIRLGSPDFGRWTAVRLSDEDKLKIYIPKGFVHGFCVLSDTALFFYKCSDFYAPECDRGLQWSDPGIGINCPIASPILSEKDNAYSLLKDVSDDRFSRWSST
jgi:dTDP-4-dehydrorhamnose 3,5-epimerase